jgi:guanosine-3',5'-bis(diphosphate) 3'-pyrophosphohydrolase
VSEQPSKNHVIDPQSALLADQEFEKLAEKIRSYMSAENVRQVEESYRFAAIAHSSQRRQSGEPYVTHPVAVASILAGLRLDMASIIAAILHDTVEDTNVTLDQIEKKFGSQVASLVDGLTKIGKVKFRSTQERLAENFRKMIVAMAKDLRVILIKLADRLHNMRTITSLPQAKADRIAQETLEIYAPLANRLGMYGIKSDLEDACLRQLRSQIYGDIKAKVAAKRQARQAYIDEVLSILRTEMKKYNFESAEVYGRPKHFYSIYKKMIDRKIDFEDIHDLFAFRIVVDSVKDCYEALGIVHAMWKPMPGRFKDYIAMPKANMYQSLHTTVIRPNGEPAEIQIRTKEMQRVCEFGVAAHWAYKEQGDTSLTGADSQKFSWLRQIVQWQSELKDPDEFLEAVKVDLFDEEIFVFTPKGDVISLPLKATCLDFAFAVHTDLGSKTISAKVNGSIATLKKPLKSGDIVEVITSTQQKPSKDWLNFVITAKAKNKIRSSLRKEQRDQGRKIGEELLDKELSERGMHQHRQLRESDLEKILKFAKESSVEELLIGIGYGKVAITEVLDRVFPKAVKILAAADSIEIKPVQGVKSDSGILVSGINNVLVVMARCCNPLPGEHIVGFITRGKGVTVHRASCSRALDLDPHRRVVVSWSQEANKGTHSAFIRVLTRDKIGVLAEVTQVITTCGANISQADIRISSDMLGVLDFQLAITDLPQLEALIRKIEFIPAVVSVERKSIMRQR